MSAWLTTIFWEKELSLFVTDHAISLFEKKDLGKVRMAGIVSELKKKKIKSGDRMGLFNLEDQTGAVEVAVMPNLLETREAIVQEDEILVVEGVASQRGDTISVRADAIYTQHEAWQQYIKEMHIHVASEALDENQVMRLKGTLLQASGNAKVVLHIHFPDIGTIEYELESPFQVIPTPTLKTSIEEMFNEGCCTFKAVAGFANNGNQRRNGN